MNLKEDLATAQHVLARTADGWWETTEQPDGSFQVINQAGFVHQAPLVVADNMVKADAEALVYCHNSLPQFLAKLAETRDQG